MSSLQKSNSRGLLNSIMIIGSAQLIKIFISIIKLKSIAILLGPSGIGLLSIYNSLLRVVNKASGLGMRTSGVREIASAKKNNLKFSRVRKVLIYAHIAQGLLAVIIVWLMRNEISILLFGDNIKAQEVGMIGIIVFLALISSSQIALLQGMRKIKELRKITILGSFFGTVVGLLAVWLYGESGLIWLVFVQPLMSVIIALSITRKLAKPIAPNLNINLVIQIWKSMAKVGIAIMIGGVVTTLTILIIRARIIQEIGLDAAGQFAAAWSFNISYIGPMLAAIGADYYPRLTETISNKKQAIELINDQTQLTLALGGPLLILLIGLAPWIIILLYSPEFTPAISILQWQSVGSIFKIAIWALIFAHIADKRAIVYFLLDISFGIAFLIFIWPLLSKLGIIAAGPAFLIANVITFSLNYICARKIFKFRWESLSIKLIIIHSCIAFLLLIVALQKPIIAALTSVVAALVTGLFGLRIVLSKVGMYNNLSVKIIKIFERAGWPIN